MKTSNLIIIIVVSSAFVGAGVPLTSVFNVTLFPIRIISIIGLLFLILIVLNKSIKKNTQGFGAAIIISLIIWATISLLWSTDKANGIKQLLTLYTGGFLTVWLIYYVGKRHTRFCLFLKTIILLSIILSILGYIEYFFGKNIFSHDIQAESMIRFKDMYGFLPPNGSYANWNNYAFDNLLLAVITFGFASILNTKTYRILALFSTTLLVGLVFISTSRAAIGSLIIGLMILIAMHSDKKNIMKLIFTLAALTTILLYSATFIQSSLILDFIYNRFSEENQLGVRSLYIDQALNSIISTFGIGSGIGSNTTILNGNNYHNFFIEIAAEFGIFFLLAITYLFATSAYYLYKKAKDTCFGSFYKSLFSSILILPLAVMGPSSIFGNMVFWLWVGLIIITSSNSLSLKTPADDRRN